MNSAIDYINEMFPTEQSLTNLDDTITEMRGNISGIDDDLRHIVRGHRAVATSESDLQSGLLEPFVLFLHRERNTRGEN